MNTEPEDPIMCRFLNEGATLVIDDLTGRVSIERDESNGPLLERIASALWKKNESEKLRSALFEVGMNVGDGSDAHAIVKRALKTTEKL